MHTVSILSLLTNRLVVEISLDVAREASLSVSRKEMIIASAAFVWRFTQPRHLVATGGAPRRGMNMHGSSRRADMSHSLLLAIGGHAIIAVVEAPAGGGSTS